VNITSGTPVQKGVALSDINLKEYMAKLIEQKFNGYMCITVKGRGGIEEGALIFHNGNIVSSDYEYYRYNKKFMAEDGLARTINAVIAKIGVVDTFSLSSYQVQLIMTLNEDCNLKNEIMSIDSLQFPKAFDYSFEDALGDERKPAKDYEKDVLLKKYGLSRMIGPKVTRAVLLESADEENKNIEKIDGKKAKK